MSEMFTASFQTELQQEQGQKYSTQAICLVVLKLTFLKRSCLALHQTLTHSITNTPGVLYPSPYVKPNHREAVLKAQQAPGPSARHKHHSPELCLPPQQPAGG